MHERLFGLMSSPLDLAVALLAGVVLGLMFYAGLWWTARGTATFRRPGLIIITSLLLRMSVALGGFYRVAGGDWVRLLVCLTGFLVARAVITWCTRPLASTPGGVQGGIEVGHAP